MNLFKRILMSVCALTASTTCFAAILATRDGLTVTTDDFYAHHFMSAPQKVQALQSSASELQSTITEVLAPRSYSVMKQNQHKLDSLERNYFNLQVERAPLLAELNVLERRARATFDSNDPLTNQRAKEFWLLDTSRYFADESADITQIFFDFALRPFAQSVERIADAEKALAGGEPFDAVLQKYTDDKNAKGTGGKLKKIGLAGTDVLMGNLIFKRLKEGDISQPTPSRLGIHIVRLDKKEAKIKRPFDEVKVQIFERLMEEAVRNVRVAFLDSLTKPETVIDKKAFEEFLIKPDPLLEAKRQEIIRELDKQMAAPDATAK